VCPSKLIFNGTNCLCTNPLCVICNAADDCSLCIAGYVLNGGNCVVQCQVANCTACNALTQCISCSQGLVPSTFGLSCVSCSNILNCESCLTNNNCSVCLPSFILTVINNISICVTCTVPNCLMCSANNACY
jgi:hypothetical protein